MDFSGLSDDQLLQLLQAAMAEAVRRGKAVYRAAADSVIDAQEKARIEREAYERAIFNLEQQEREQIASAAARRAEQEIKQKKQQEYESSQSRIWSKQKAMHLALFKWGVADHHQLNVWNRDGDKRIYFEGLGKNDWKICLYVSGNLYHPPGEMDFTKPETTSSSSRLRQITDKNSPEFKQLKEFLQLVAQHWNSLKSVSEPAMIDSIIPFETHLEKYGKALSLESE